MKGRPEGPKGVEEIQMVTLDSYENVKAVMLVRIRTSTMDSRNVKLITMEVRTRSPMTIDDMYVIYTWHEFKLGIIHYDTV